MWQAGNTWPYEKQRSWFNSTACAVRLRFVSMLIDWLGILHGNDNARK